MTAHTFTEGSNPTTQGAALRERGAAPVAISIRGVSKTYPVPLTKLKQVFRMKTKEPVTALRGLSFEVREGEVFGLIGRNGAGKTTLAKIIATLVQPTSGAVVVRGFDSVRDEERVRAQIGLATAEERSFYWRLTVEQNLTFFARLYGLSTRATRRRITEMLALFEMGELRRRRFGELSTGNKQRMAVARALLNAPPVLLLDEPTRSLDPLAAAGMRSLIGSLAHAEPPVTVLLTSHNLAEVEELCERVAIIGRGRIRAVDAPHGLRTTHRSRERVRLSLRGMTGEDARRILKGVVDEMEVTREGERTVVGFRRDDGDERLDRAVRLLTAGGATLLACETERGTLLDALESYEREEEHEGGGAGGNEGAGGDDNEGDAGRGRGVAKSRSLVLLFSRVRAFVVRDFQLAVSYRLEFFMRLVSILFVTTTLFFISQIFAGRFDTPYEQWRDPFLAWITALPFLNYFMVGFSSLANAIRSEQAQGTLESVLMTPINIPTLIVASSGWDFLLATFHSFLYLFFGWSLFGVQYRGNFLLALLFLVLTTLVLASVGILSASFAMVFKRGDPFGVIIGTGSALFSGVFFPTQLMSKVGGEGFGYVSRILPTTHGIDGIRRVLIQGQGFAEARRPLLTLLVYLAVLLPFALWVFTRAVRRAKREGSLIQY